MLNAWGVGVLVALVVGEMGWALVLWYMWRARALRCSRSEARYALCSAHLRKALGLLREVEQHAIWSVGTCCCGEDMATHSDPMSCGHTPRDQLEYHMTRRLEDVLLPAQAFLESARPTWLHLKRGTRYHVLADGIRMNFARRVRDGDEMTLYQDVDSGSLSVRTSHEFLDGRFSLLGHCGSLPLPDDNDGDRSMHDRAASMRAEAAGD